MKANKIYLERIRKNDWVDRSPESNITLNPMSLQEFARQLELSVQGMKKAAEILNKNP